MKVYLIIILIFISCFSYSQKKQSNLYIKINTLSLVDVLSFPTLQLSLEKRISPSFSLNPEVGYQLYSENENKFLGGTSLDTVFLKERGFKASVEARFYLAKIFPKIFQLGKLKKTHNGLFCGLQIFYRQNQETNTISYYKNETSEPNQDVINYLDYFGIKRKAYGLNFTTGIQLSKKRVIFEPSIGIGIMNRIIKNYNIQYDDSKDLISDSHYFFPNLENDSGTSVNVSLCLRFGYQL